MQNYWESNRAALLARYPNLANRMENAACEIAIAPSRSGAPTAEVPGISGSVPLHSRYDPIREASREADTATEVSGAIILLGMGLGHTVRELVETRRDRFFDLLVIERDPRIFRAALEAVPLAKAFQDRRVHFAVGEEIPAVIESVRKLLPTIMSSHLNLFQHRPSLSLYPDYYQRVSEEIQHLLTHTQAEFQLMLQSGPRLQENMWRNLPKMIGQAGICHVEDRFRNIPAFVVAAGPSLNRNLSELSHIKESGLIICVDTSYKVLEQAGITPHAVVATDPTELNERHFHGLAMPKGPVLAYDPEVYFTIPAAVPWPGLVMNLDKCATTRWFERTFGPWGVIEKGGSVANTAFLLARAMGCDPIVLVGLDLAYDPSGGASHAEGTALARRFDAPAEGSSSVVMAPHAATKNELNENLVWVDGVFGSKVPTSQIMALYIHKFEEHASRSGIRVIDATEGGALIRGTEVLSLSEAVAESCKEDRNIRERLAESMEDRSGIDLVPVREAVGKIGKDLREASEQARIGLGLVERLIPETKRGAALRDDPVWIQMEETFSRIYDQPSVKVGVEQAMFSAVYYFCQKEPDDAVGERLEKYRVYFQQAAGMCNAFGGLLEQIAGEI